MKRLLFILVIFLSLAAEARQPSRGYRGFIEWSSSLRSEKFGLFDFNGNLYTYRQNTFYTGLTTSHGYQIDSMFFIGAGLGMERCGSIVNWVAPVFLQGRVDLKFGKWTPFGDIRLGANMAEGVGMYFSPSIGYRFNWGRKMGVNIGAGLTLAGYRAEHYDVQSVGPDDFKLQYVGTKHHVRPYFSFRVGIDF